MQFRELEYVLAIAKHQSIGKAAKDLYVSQPTLSKFIRNLEDSIGIPLFSKLGNHFILTYAGQKYVEAAKSILSIKKLLDSELADIKNEDAGELKIAFRMCGGIGILPELLSRFQQQYPHVRVSVLEDSSGNIEQNLVSGELDLAFIALPVKHPAISYEVLSREEILLVMSPDHPYANSGVAVATSKYPWFDLSIAKQERFILQQPSQKTRRSTDELFRRYKITPNIAATISNIEIAVQLASEGYGLAFAGEVPLQQIKTNKPVSLFSVGSPKTELQFAVAYRDGIYFSSSMRAFISIAKSILKSGGTPS